MARKKKPEYQQDVALADYDYFLEDYKDVAPSEYKTDPYAQGNYKDVAPPTYDYFTGVGVPPTPLAPKKSDIPELEPMAELPMPEGEQARQARRRSLLKQKRRRGRESTILSSPVSLLSEEIGV